MLVWTIENLKNMSKCSLWQGKYYVGVKMDSNLDELEQERQGDLDLKP